MSNQARDNDKWKRSVNSNFYPTQENIGDYEDPVQTTAPYSWKLPTTTSSNLTQGQIYHNVPSHTINHWRHPMPQTSPPTTESWRWSSASNYSTTRNSEEAYQSSGQTVQESQNAHQPHITLPYQATDLLHQPTDPHDQSTDLHVESLEADNQTSSPGDETQLTYNFSRQRTSNYGMDSLHPDHHTHGPQLEFCAYQYNYPNPASSYNPQNHDRNQYDSLENLSRPLASPSATSLGDEIQERSTSVSRSTSRSKSKPAFPCEIEECAASFTRLADLQRHQATVHSEDKPFPCHVKNCSRVRERGFSRRDHLTEHLRSYHQIDIPKRKPGQRAAPQSLNFESK